MVDKVFVDSNLWVYLFSSEDNSKYKASEQFILNNSNKNALVISYQVINEVCHVLLRKKFSEQDIQKVIGMMTKICIVQDYSKEISLLASNIRDKYSFSFWDSHIVASAVTSQCGLLASEDMQDGFSFGKMTIRNIFTESFNLL